ncbi:CDP-glycerol glycerophosphotransferase family protein [Dyadobacter sp. CY326]|uniref:CDP-glycerol glycerophosphotransferase family protein n=1 Tax=Dyadobacter sp. CY326 TaxID=2907300 RepID=UPI001F3D5899|nr:CDP-glycerol glycerophosphotransferase family protein [Dyadobacter sp. CY326]MCE7068078.1 CDP-glycerol glycerophosphotransferase family protein [Dyadobacter sp. CY326]
MQHDTLHMAQFYKKPVLLLITNSFAAINIIHSGLIKKLAMRYDIHLLSTMIRERELATINNHFAIDLKLLEIELPIETMFISLLRKLEKALFAGHHNIATQQIKYERLTWTKRLVIKTAILILVQLHLSGVILKLLRRVIIVLSSFSCKLRPLLHYKFQGVISSSPLDLRENHVTNFLQKHGVKSLAMIISWDNLTSKGVINANHDCTLVWNQLMKSEFQRFYSMFDVNQNSVKITGIPRFDLHFRNIDNVPLANAKARYAINAAKVIFIATSAIKHFPNQLEIIKDVLAYAALEGDTHVIIRCHPADDHHAYQDLFDKNSVTVWHPRNLVTSSKRSFYHWLPDMDFLTSLSEMLHISDVCIQFASTIKLDAAACGTSIISVAYDGTTALPYHQSVKRLYDYAHQLPLNALQWDVLVADKQELYNVLTEILSKKSKKPPADIALLTHFAQAQSVDCTAQTIAEWLD